MATNEAPNRAAQSDDGADERERTAAGTAETDVASGVEDPRLPDSLDGYGVTADGITDGASSAKAGAYGEENDATRNGSNRGAGEGQVDEGLTERLRTPGSPV